jgi:NAD(P)H-hydrate epimerase
VSRIVCVLSAAQAAATDAATIAAGTPSLTLMERAGSAAVEVIRERHGPLLHHGVRIHTGPGNNGGDGWVVARLLAEQGVPVSVESAADPKTEDARTMSQRATAHLTSDRLTEARVVVDALLGTGATGEPRGAIADAVRNLLAARASGAKVVALDVPSGLDATSGVATLAAPAECTITFGSVKRGQLISRDLIGTLFIVDIGLKEPVGDGTIAGLVTAEWTRDNIPPIPADAHKGTRRKLAIIGGAEGMAGAVILAARSALRAGIGMVRVVVHRSNVPVVQGAVPAALAAAWPTSDDEARALLAWADGALIGPGLGASALSRELVERLLAATDRPVTLDADALNVFHGEAEALGAQLAERPALLTPHPAEAARLCGVSVEEVLTRRFEIAGELAARARAGVLLKGVPTVIAGVDGRTMVSARGTAALATAGSGDVVAGIAATLLVQTGHPLRAGASAAFVHGRAAELADPFCTVRGVAIDDVVNALARVWHQWPAAPIAPVLSELPGTGAVA